MSLQPPSLLAGPGAGLQGLARGPQGAEESPGNDGAFALHKVAREQKCSPLGLGFHGGCAKIFGHLSHVGGVSSI